MSFELNEKIVNLIPYEPINGSYRIRLDANESFTELPKDILKEVLEAIEDVHFNRYPDSKAGDVCTKFADYYNISPQYVTAGNGSDELITVIMTAFLQKGDKVVTLAPDFSMYKFYASLVEANCTEFKKKDDFSVDFDKLISLINKQNARMVIFSNPCNPTSVGFKADDVRKLIKSVDAMVVLDEAYMDFWDQSLLAEFLDYDNLIILRTCSKAVGLASIRLGFAVSNSKITNVLRAAKSPYNVNTLTQTVGSIVLSKKDYLNRDLEHIKASTASLYDELKKIEENVKGFTVLKSNTNFITVKTKDSKDIFEYLLGKGIIIRNFGGFIRITSGRNHENAELIDAVKTYYNIGVTGNENSSIIQKN